MYEPGQRPKLCWSYGELNSPALRELQKIYQHNLNQLEIRAAKAGMNVSVEVSNEIEECRAKLREIKEEIRLIELDSIDLSKLSEEEEKRYEEMKSRTKSKNKASQD